MSTPPILTKNGYAVVGSLIFNAELRETFIARPGLHPEKFLNCDGIKAELEVSL
jgi:hypothetical protein